MNRTMIALLCLLAGIGAGATAAGMFFTDGEPARTIPRAGTSKPTKSGDDSEASAPTANEHRTRPESSAPSTTKTGSDAASSPSPAPAAGIDPTAESPEALLARAIRAFAPDAFPTGDGMIAGSVKTADGRPLAGATVRARIIVANSGPREQGAGKNSGVSVSKPLSDEIRDAIKSGRRSREAFAETKTRGDGTYALGNLATDRKYWLTGYLDGWQVRAADSRLAGDAICGSSVEFTATQLADVTFEVLLPDGSKAARANISTVGTDPEARREFTWRPEAPTAELKPGTYSATATVLVTGDWDAAALAPRSSRVSFEAVLSGGTAPVVLQTKLPAGIMGAYVVLPRKATRTNGGRGATIVALKVENDAMPAYSKLSNSRSRTDVVANNPRNKYSIVDVTPGRYVVALLDSERVAAHSFVDVADTMVTVDLTASEPDPSTVILVHVTGPDSQVVDDCSLRITITGNSGYEEDGGYYDGEWYGYGGGGAWQRPDGTYVLPLARGGATLSAEKRAKAKLAVTTKGLGSRSVPLPVGSNEMTVEFQAPGWIALSVEGADVFPDKELLRATSTNDATKAQTYSLATEGASNPEYGPGYYVPGGGSGGAPPAGLTPSPTLKVIGPLEPGQYTVTLSASSGGTSDYWASINAAKTTVTVTSGVNRVSISLPYMQRLTISAPDLDPGTQFSINLEKPTGASGTSPGGWGGGGTAYSPTDSSRKVTFKCLVAGTYMITPSNGKKGKMRITLPGPTEITYAAQTLNALSVYVYDKTGAMGTAGFVTGDVIVGADGVEFSDEAVAGKALKDSYAKETATAFIVMRDGVRMTISMVGNGIPDDQRNNKAYTNATPRP